MKKLLFLLVVSILLQRAAAQPSGCTFDQPIVTVHFGAGENVRDINEAEPAEYERVGSSCPTDGYYAYTGYTSDCFRGDWLTLAEDHTPNDAAGNMMLVNASRNSGIFFRTTLKGLKSNTTFEFAVWLMNVCRISDKCPFPLLPNITIELKTPGGKTVAQFNTGELVRRNAPHWTRYRGLFVMPAGETAVTVTMADNAPGGCGNDFAMDDITIRECIKPIPTATPALQKTAPVAKKTQPVASPAEKKQVPKQTQATTPPRITIISKNRPDTPAQSKPRLVPKQPVLPPPPQILTTRANPLVKQIETEAGEIKLDLYDNGEIDGDTVTIYHNNQLLVARAKLSQKPISFRIMVDAAQPHHELVMVADNLGSIPPNTSLMIVTTKSKRYQVFISSTEQKNAKVVIDLNE